jgi:hypothetical protein
MIQMRRSGIVVLAGLAMVLGGCDLSWLTGGPKTEVAKVPDLPPPATCEPVADRAAIETRIYQTDLMVAALSCGEHERYNSFVQRYQDPLVANGKNLQDFFHRTYAGNAKKELNAYVTQLANDASKRSIANIRIFCQDTSQQFTSILAAEPAEFRNFVVNYPEVRRQGARICAQIADLGS